MLDSLSDFSGAMASRAGLLMLGLATTVAQTTMEPAHNAMTTGTTESTEDEGISTGVTVAIAGVLATGVVITLGVLGCRRASRNAEIIRLASRANDFPFAAALMKALGLPSSMRTDTWRAFAQYAAKIERTILGVPVNATGNLRRIPEALCARIAGEINQTICNDLEQAGVIRPNDTEGQGWVFSTHSCCCAASYPAPPTLVALRRLLPENLRAQLNPQASAAGTSRATVTGGRQAQSNRERERRRQRRQKRLGGRTERTNKHKKRQGHRSSASIVPV